MMEDELTPDEKRVFEKLSGEQFDTRDLCVKVLHDLEDRGLIDKQIKNTMKKTILQIAASLAILITGYFIGSYKSLNTDKMNDRNMYALFLYENQEFTVNEGNKLVEEYSAWAGNLGSQQKLVYAEKLNDDEDLWLGAPSIRNSNSKLSGYFVFYAQDMEEARRIAETHPHTNYGGGLELRSIDKIE